MKTITVLGSGNMGEGLISGLLKSNYPPENLWATDRDKSKLIALQNKFGINVTSDNAFAVAESDCVIFAIKPQVFAEVATALKPIIQAHQPLVISIAAGIRLSSIEKWLGDNVAIIRSMPNMPALIGCGATALIANKNVDVNARQFAESILTSVGIITWLEDEKLMDVVTALSGSGPAYFFLVIEALQDAAIEAGLSKEIARALTVQTALGAARIASEQDLPLQVLRQNITSKGGTTEAALIALEEANIRELFRNALQAAKMRSEELAESMGK